MKIEIWGNDHRDFPEYGPYKLLDTIEKNDLYQIGDMTHYGPVISFLPFPAGRSGDVNQSAVVRLMPASMATRPIESIRNQEHHMLNKIRFFPIRADPLGYLKIETRLADRYSILPDQNLTIEKISQLITSETYAVWKRDCFLSKGVVDSLERVDHAIVHRYTSESYRNGKLDSLSLEIVNLAVACLSLIRPTRRGHAGVILGVITEGTGFQPQQFTLNVPTEVPQVQRLYGVRPQDVQLFQSVLPEFLQLYLRDEAGSVHEDYEPLRMAVQLYEQAYSVHYWKARHILWWSAVEALYGNSEDAVMARIYAMFGDGDLSVGFERSIYEHADTPSSFPITSANDHKLGEVVPLIYEVRNFSAHGGRVPEWLFKEVPHPLDGSASVLDVLAEAVTFIIRKTIIGLLSSGLRMEFRDRAARDQFWLYRFGLDNKQSKRRLQGLKDLKGDRTLKERAGARSTLSGFGGTRAGFVDSPPGCWD